MPNLQTLTLGFCSLTMWTDAGTIHGALHQQAVLDDLQAAPFVCCPRTTYDRTWQQWCD
ncbi:hypothetical protein PR003_g8590 [Phytophthora rubi]|uniref:Uncharacterized protein n=1 Tax=Phytophthora rubi TaxID=129364 RepID=A0A6A3NT98_9STRA|nr:hypothetical protein PR002_g4799 [Phytophthora rubi]KAE9046413.1 hypothetical protein PR001_g4569 [Phytophthora rubi]KAE9344174.1 hypothetical protein PR003_g8590 [Phytophthora rubi]